MIKFSLFEALAEVVSKWKANNPIKLGQSHYRIERPKKPKHFDFTVIIEVTKQINYCVVRKQRDSKKKTNEKEPPAEPEPSHLTGLSLRRQGRGQNISSLMSNKYIYKYIKKQKKCKVNIFEEIFHF